MTTVSRREFVKAGGLLIGFSMADAGLLPRVLAAPVPVDNGTGEPEPNRLESWIRIADDGTVHVFTGKVEIGMGIETAFGQIVAEELDTAPANVKFVMGDTAQTNDQGGVGGSTSIMLGAAPLRNAAATARELLLEMAAKRFGVLIEQLQIKNSQISVKDDDSKRISFGALVSAVEIDAAVKASGGGFTLNVQGVGRPKKVADYTLVGKPLQRVDIPPKVYGRWQYVTDVRVPGMLHGRVVRPAGVGSKLENVDESSVRGIAGYLQTVVKGDFVGVVAENEWAAIQAAKKLKVAWSAPAKAFPDQKDLYKYMRETAPKATQVTEKQGDADAALAAAAKKITASYDFPFQSHATMGPGCAVADVHVDALTTVWSGGQKPHALRSGFAELLGVPLERVRVIWVEDAGSYGRPGFEDAAADAVLLSRAVGKPVRVQWTRADMTSWGAKGPAVTCDLAAGIDAGGQVTALQFTSRAFSGGEVHYQPTTAGNFLGAQLSGIPNKGGVDEFARWGDECAPYHFANLRAVSHVVPSFFDTTSPLRCTHLRDPEGPATSFAVESFMDELAAAAGADPVEFRIRYLDEPRAKAVLTAAAAKAAWEKRPSPKKPAAAGEIARGRGIGLSTRNGTYVGTVAEVEVNRSTGNVRVTRLVCAHDCGLIINPDTLGSTIAANLIQSLSRSMKEEVLFDRSNVTSADWITYPVARASDIPAQVEIELINHPELPPGGAGEPASRATAAAIANAIFDATGARVRQAPLTPPRVKAALSEIKPA